MNPTLRLAAFAALVLAAAQPGPAPAEGNRLTLTCDPLLPPEAERGAAEEGTDDATALPRRPVFSFAPLKLDRDGAGRVEVTTPDGRTATGVTASFQGPYAWTLDTTLHTLTVKGTTDDGRTLVLWHRLDQAQDAVPPEGDLMKLLCEVS